MDNFESLWLKYTQSVRDYETVFRHMYKNKISTRTALLYTEWAFMLEKYSRDFDAANLVYQTGLKKVSDERQEKLIQCEYKKFAERMRLRISRDVICPLSKGGSSQSSLEQILAAAEDAPPTPKTVGQRKKRTYEQAFGAGEEDSESTPQLSKKRMLLDSDEVKEYGTLVSEYSRGMTLVQAKDPASSESNGQTINPYKKEVTVLDKLPLSFLGQEAEEEEKQMPSADNN